MWIRSLIASLARPRLRNAASTRQSARRLVMEGLEDRRLLTFLPATSFPAGDAPVALVTADFNHDGHLDLATANRANSTVSVLLGDGQGGFGAARSFATGASPSSLVVGDFDADGNLDLVTASPSLSYVSVLLGNGDGALRPAVTTDIRARLPDQPVSLAPVADYTGDGKSDLAFVTYVYSEWSSDYSGIEILESYGEGVFASRSANIGFGSIYPSVAVADLNADGKPDLITTLSYFDEYSGDYLGGVNVYVSGNQYGYSIPAGGGSQVAVGDFTRDNIPDLVIAGQTLDILPGDGDGNFWSPISTPVITGVAGLADFNGDGNLDIDSGGSVLLGLGDGTFKEPYAAPTSRTVGDFNGDGLPDVASIDSGAVAVRLNDGVWPVVQQLPPAVRVGNVTVTEGNTGTTSANFTVSLSKASSETITVAYATADGDATAGSDYVAGSGTLTFAPGETSQTITVPVTGDRAGESDESFFVNLMGATNATISDSQGIGMIVDNEPRISISDATVNEGNTGTRPITFAVSLSAAYDVPVTISYTTGNGTATAGSDYQARSGTLTITAGQTSGIITVQASGDRLAEPNETFVANLSNLNYGVIADGQGIGTIGDDEPRISISDVSKSEGKKNQTTLFTFTATLSAAYDQPVTMSYRTVDGTATIGDGDYVAKTGTLTFAPGETTKTITIVVNGDSKKEANEAFYLDLFGNSSNSSFTKTRGIGTILNDD